MSAGEGKVRNIAKLERARRRLERGSLIYRWPSGQWSFGGNKFVPDRIVAKLPLELVYTDNRGRDAYQLDDAYGD